MMKKLLCALVALALLMSAACGVGESLFVDNRETDKVYPERLNLRAQPTKNGAILGRISDSAGGDRGALRRGFRLRRRPRGGD